MWNRQLSSIRSTVLRLSDNFRADLPTGNTLHASTVIAIERPAYPTASPHRVNETREVRNINRMSIGYAFRPHLRYRLTLLRLALSRNPWTFGGSVSHTAFVTHVSIRTSDSSSMPLDTPSQPYGTLLYHPWIAPWIRSFGSRLEPRYIFRAGRLDQ